jgi:NAD(P)-dependent dehydrogenase (short-subunit alcohol dehydrogenase family)
MLRTDVSESTLEAFRAQVPLGRFAEPSDVAGAVLFLASEHASYITGTTLNVSGGQLVY